MPSNVIDRRSMQTGLHSIMISLIALPKFDANITEATIGEWHVEEGDRVEVGDVIVEILTDKANFEFTAESPGLVRKILAPEKSQVPLGYIIAIVGEADDELPDVSAENDQMMREYRESVTGKTVAAPTDNPQTPLRTEKKERVRATPRARRLARQHGIDLAQVRDRAGVEVVSEKEVQDHIEENKS